MSIKNNFISILKYRLTFTDLSTKKIKKKIPRIPCLTHSSQNYNFLSVRLSSGPTIIKFKIHSFPSRRKNIDRKTFSPLEKKILPRSAILSRPTKRPKEDARHIVCVATRGGAIFSYYFIGEARQ